MDSRIDALEKNMEAMRQKMEERDECVNHQMEDLKNMFASLMTKLSSDPTFDRDKGGVSGVSRMDEERSVQQDEKEMVEDETKQWVRRKVDLPNFDGNDPTGWLVRAEKFFEIHEIKPELRVEMAFVSMEGPAIHWFQCLKLRWPELTWEKLREELLNRYCGRRSGNVYEQLASLKQTGSIVDYVEEYERAAAQLGAMPEEQRLGYFMNGLQGEIKQQVRT